MSEYNLTKDDEKYGVPQQKKFPLPDADHVKSAIKFFNYVESKYEEELAKAIIKRAKQYNVDLSEMNIGDNNRFKKYLAHSDELYHRGIKGWSKKDHKYISRFWKNGKWFYVYKNGKQYNKLQDWLGVDEKDAFLDAHSKALNAPHNEEGQKLHLKYEDALSAYLKTPLAKIEKYSAAVSDSGKYFIDKLKQNKKRR